VQRLAADAPAALPEAVAQEDLAAAAAVADRRSR
jgi:hypothetical protein